LVHLNREGCMRSILWQLRILGTVSAFLEDGKTEKPCVKMADRPVAGPTGCLLTASRHCGSRWLIIIVEAVFSVRCGLNVCNFDSRPVTAEAPVLPRASPCDQVALGQVPHPAPRQNFGFPISPMLHVRLHLHGSLSGKLRRQRVGTCKQSGVV
jgi:hypothetical protein